MDATFPKESSAVIEHIYVHVPFCRRRCPYCDFYTEAGRLDRAAEYVDRVRSEIERAGASGLQIRPSTIFVGGGTPTALKPGLLGRLLAELLSLARSGAEVTVEANPVTVSAAMADALMSAGVNRVSLGVQSFQPRLRENLGRAGKGQLAMEAVDYLRWAGFSNISLDLIFGIPGQEEADLERDLEKVLEAGVQHVSCYGLTVKPGGPYHRRWSEELAEMESKSESFYDMVVERLEGAGFNWYETSNFAIPGYECRHNLAYWRGEDYIGFGAGAWSTVGPDRWSNVEDIDAYIDEGWRGPHRHLEVLSQETRMREKLMLGLRLAEGVLWDDVSRIVDLDQQNILQRNGFIANEGGRMFLTRAGRFMANEVCARLLKD